MKDLIGIAIEAALRGGEEILKVYSSTVVVDYKTDRSPLTLADINAHKVIAELLSVTGIPLLSEEGSQIRYEERKDWAQYWLVDPLDGTKEFINRNGEFTVNIALISGQEPVAGVIYIPVQDILYIGIHGDGAYKLDNALTSMSEKPDDTLLPDTVQTLPLFFDHDCLHIVASRSHMSDETLQFINELEKKYGKSVLVSAGSSLKLCLIAEGKADIYPRFGPTMEWDTAAGQAIVMASGGTVTEAQNETNLLYNKENLLNPWFIARKKGFH